MSDTGWYRLGFPSAKQLSSATAEVASRASSCISSDSASSTTPSMPVRPTTSYSAGSALRRSSIRGVPGKRCRRRHHPRRTTFVKQGTRSRRSSGTTGAATGSNSATAEYSFGKRSPCSATRALSRRSNGIPAATTSSFNGSNVPTSNSIRGAPALTKCCLVGLLPIVCE